MSLLRWWLHGAPRDEHGQAMLFVLLFFPLLLTVAGIAIGTSELWAYRVKAQAAADAAALAGADTIANSTCPGVTGSPLYQACGQYYAQLNGFTDGVGGASVSVVPANNNTTSCPTSGSFDNHYVLACITQPISPLVFAPGLFSFTLSAHAVAKASSGSTSPCAVDVLHPSATQALQATGNGSVDVKGGCIQVNSNASGTGHGAAVYAEGNASIIGEVGGIQTPGTCAASGNAFISTCTTDTAAPDPLAGVPIPSSANDPTWNVMGSAPSGQHVNNGSTCQNTPPDCFANGNDDFTIDPGVFHSIQNNGNGLLTLNPGIYIITSTMQLNGNGRVSGSGVMLYFACPSTTAPYWQNCAPGQQGGALHLTGNACYGLSAPTSGVYQGMLIFYDRNDSSSLSLGGNGCINPTTGTIYAASALADITGNGEVFSSLLVVSTIKVEGNGADTINYVASQNYPVSSPPGAASLTE